MRRTYTDFAQLKGKLFEQPAATPTPARAPATKSRDSRADEECLNYFARALSGTNGTVKEHAKPEPSALPEPSACAAELEAARAAVAAAEARAQEAQRAQEEAVARLKVVQSERDRLENEGVNLRKQLASLQALLDASTEPDDHPALPEVKPPVAHEKTCLLIQPKDLDEVFPGEAREIVLAALAEARDTAQSSGRERRAAVLAAVEAANPSSGELMRRRAELRQVMKDSGYTNDPKALEALGFRLISGRNHLKLQYANVRITLSKTPSDYRASRNAAGDIANHCF